MLFSFEEWVKWWEDNLGPDWLKKRGVLKVNYVMCRKADKGHYHPDNVYCATSSQNMTDSNLLKPRGGGSYMLGKKHKPETIKKMSNNHSGQENPFFGKTHSPETKAKMKESWVINRERKKEALKKGWERKRMAV